MCLDKTQKKIVFGDTEGQVQVLNYSNGAGIILLSFNLLTQKTF